MVVDFCLPDPGQSMLAAYQEWRHKSEKAATDYGFHMAVTSWSKQIYDEMETVVKTHAIWRKHIATPLLNRWLAEVQERHPPPLVAGRRLRLRFMSQATIRPPTFALFASKPGELPDSYRRYLVNLLRTDFDLPSVPIRMMLRKGKNPYA